jgi:hypothetical protein
MLRPQGGRPVRLGTRGVTGVHVRVILRSFQHRSVPVEWCAARKRVVQILFHYQIKLPTRVRLWAPPSAPQSISAAMTQLPLRFATSAEVGRKRKGRVLVGKLTQE